MLKNRRIKTNDKITTSKTKSIRNRDTEQVLIEITTTLRLQRSRS